MHAYYERQAAFNEWIICKVSEYNAKNQLKKIENKHFEFTKNKSDNIECQLVTKLFAAGDSTYYHMLENASKNVG